MSMQTLPAIGERNDHPPHLAGRKRKSLLKAITLDFLALPFGIAAIDETPVHAAQPGTIIGWDTQTIPCIASETGVTGFAAGYKHRLVAGC